MKECDFGDAGEGWCRRLTGMIPIWFLALGLLVIQCSDKVSGPGNSIPVIDTVIFDPESVHPGADIIMTVEAHDPDGDSIVYRWSTYPGAARFSNYESPQCTLTVSSVLSGGMSLKVILEVDDGVDTTSEEFWIPLVEGNTISGYVYYAQTSIPLQYVEVMVGRLIDTTSYKGSYAVRHVPIGNRIITISTPGCNDFVDTLSVTGDTELDIYVECPDLAKTVTGQVATATGTELENVRVTLLNKDGSPTPLSDLTDVSGNFSIDFIPAGYRSFQIEDEGNQDYEILTDTFEVLIENDTTINLRGRIRERVFVSDGIESPGEWLFGDDGIWKGWLIDVEYESYNYNSCLINGAAKLTMAHPLPIPVDAGGISWSIDISLTEGFCTIGYILDDEVVGTSQFANGSGDFEVTRQFYSQGHDPAGKDFSVEFYSWGTTSGVCSIVHIKHFEIFYYR
nr:carboxypeptidase regulatory-like domain-containing protein [candidate division Zixibacteria bacterium]